MNATQQGQGMNASQDELDRFGALASQWWDENGPQRPLHDLNPVRLDYIRNRAPLEGRTVLDVGCGGGLLSEALARAGAKVTALDLAPELIEVARLHLLEARLATPGLEVEYLLTAVEQLAAERPAGFDVVCCMEMIEHVPDPAAVIAACARLLKPGGQLFVSTLNRTPAAFAFAIVGAEYVARLLPRGTHRYAQFVRPAELGAWMREAGLSMQDVSGVLYDPLRRRARLSSLNAVNYMAAARKPE
ncbi:bifunctional 2-polyprenyl-6-hydroxyphenol methylase/3-demethylubiquinol 3-O-methyltransferase UbiG [Coralloluteibacterium stylophorae]|uniref:Ubiquinone biosynthesis O-methyltransferase n=2 Tax=Coralloluteibacterium stylophorae TaxID=1776034 RepID=A0AAP2C6X5_9GAMM|nr:bifunctional 2-polyprenyl-6-hydroxyphenol methylase/3-demethylubiquinol 3-O-methyltransferase UbiG [Coralloluteibacterium stylophorae]MBS7455668.1 bifunctional 2-polyprenyl-6-hydroxyphenol methylase/3-demethylubiquinol 3-O-methyltransferase UbiG [Coralloluteibacterium stylophorae]